MAILNVAYFGVEFVAARLLGSVSLFADSVDFLEDGLINFLIFGSVAMSLVARSRIGSVLAFVILVPAVATIWTAIVKIADPLPPETVPLSLTALGALIVNLACAIILLRHRKRQGSMAKAAWLSARNDAFANLAIIAAAGVTIVWVSGWPDIIVGVAIGVLNAGAAHDVWVAARAERLEAGRAQP